MASRICSRSRSRRGNIIREGHKGGVVVDSDLTTLLGRSGQESGQPRQVARLAAAREYRQPLLALAPKRFWAERFAVMVRAAAEYRY